MAKHDLGSTFIDSDDEDRAPTSDDPVEAELQRYAGIRCSDELSGDKLLSWWRDRQQQLPLMAQVARSILTIPCTSCGAEPPFRMRMM